MTIRKLILDGGSDTDVLTYDVATDSIKLLPASSGSYTDEQARDAIGAALVEGAGIDITVDDSGDTITIASTITQYTDEMVDDRVAALLVAGNNIDITYNDGANTLTIDVESLTSADISDFAEAAQDAIGAMIADTATIDFTYTDATPELKADVKNNSITESHLTTSVAGAGLAGGNGTALSVNVDGVGTIISSDTVVATGNSKSNTAVYRNVWTVDSAIAASGNANILSVPLKISSTETATTFEIELSISEDGGDTAFASKTRGLVKYTTGTAAVAGDPVEDIIFDDFSGDVTLSLSISTDNLVINVANGSGVDINVGAFVSALQTKK